ncbi:hypothetical protein AGMMS49942_07040 [Spirochaetia bacterium]|nr:hypothetical protein AGMMS49942_07040 [Spirochaetia bacterium]
MGLVGRYGYRGLFLITVLLSGCDVFNAPLKPFIDSQFSDAQTDAIAPAPEVPPAASDAKEITAFIVTSPVVAVGTITGTAIAVTVPYATAVTNIVPIITHTGASISPASGAARDFTGPVTYTVTAADGSTQGYTVTVTVQQPVPGTDVVFLQSTKTFFTTLQGAVAASSGTAADPDTIILCADISMGATVTILTGQHVKLIARDAARAINRDASFGSLIIVESNGSLELGGDLPLTIDGKGVIFPATAALITVQGTLKMSSDAITLQNNENTGSNGGGGVYVDGGIFTMSGGSITGNTASSGGNSLYVVNSGTAKYGDPWGTNDILSVSSSSTNSPLPYGSMGPPYMSAP